MISDFFFINYYTPVFFPNNLSLFLCCQAIIVPVILNFRESVRVFLCTYSACPLSFSPAVLARNRSFRIGTYISYIISRIEKAKVISFVILIFSFIPSVYNNIDFSTVIIIRFWYLILSVYVWFLWLIDDKLIVYPWEY